MKFFQRIKQALCRHVVDPRDIRRVEPLLVEATCWKCGKVMRAEYGLALPTKFLQNPKRPVSQPVTTDLLDAVHAIRALGQLRAKPTPPPSTVMREGQSVRRPAPPPPRAVDPVPRPGEISFPAPIPDLSFVYAPSPLPAAPESEPARSGGGGDFGGGGASGGWDSSSSSDSGSSSSDSSSGSNE